MARLQRNPDDMSFLEHLEQLRWHIIRSAVAIGVFAILTFVFRDFVVGDVLLGPSRVEFITYQWLCRASEYISQWVPFDFLCVKEIPLRIISRKMTGQVSMAITIALVSGLVIAFPYVFWEIWRFVAPGLYTRERTRTQGAVLVVSFLFLLGVAFGYFMIAPLSVQFLANFRLAETINNEIDVISYVMTIVTLTLACGVMFQMPMVSYFLTKVGIINPKVLAGYRRHSLVFILIISALITPQDPISMMLMALPLVLLYEVSIWICKLTYRKLDDPEEILPQAP